MNKRIILNISLTVLAVFLFGTLISVNSSADYQSKCDYDHCHKPTPTPKCTPTPTLKICNEDHPCTTPTPTITPTVTPTPSASPSPTPTVTTQIGTPASASNNPSPVAQCTVSFPAPKIVSYTNKESGTVNFAWTEAQTVDKYSITYGYSPNNLNMGEDNIPGNVTNWDIHQLNPGNHVWAQVQAWVNGCEESSNVYDPVIK